MEPATMSLDVALVAAQKEMPAVEPNATNPHFKSKFVTLDHLIAKTRPVLNKHGLSISQWPSVIDGQPALVTRLAHVSGEAYEQAMPLLGGTDMQKLGAALTYARRYAWAAALGISADEDDDGETAAAPAPAAAKPAATNGTAPLASAAEQKKLDRLIANLGNLDGTRDWASIADKYAKREFGHGREQLTPDELTRTVAALNAHLASLQPAGVS